VKPSRPWIASIVVLAFFASCMLKVSFASHRTSEFAGAQLLATSAKEPAGSNRHHSRREAATPDFAAAKAPRPSGAYGDLPLSFEENRGQTDARVKYLARGKGYTLFLTPDESVLAFRYFVETPDGKTASPAAPAIGPKSKKGKWSQAVLDLQLTGARSHAKIQAIEPLPGISNYFIGNDASQWRTGIPNYRKVVYRNVYPGVDAAYYGNPGMLETDFIVAPGANPGAIEMRVSGAQKIRVDESGDLILETEAGEVRLHKPVAYQEAGGARHEVAGGYRLRGEDRIAFSVGAYDRKQPLIIDPTLTYSTYLGGSGGDQATSVAVNGAGEAFVTGFTSSPNFPTKTPIQSGLGGGGAATENAFVSEFLADGSALVFSTYLGGGASDQGFSIALDSTGDPYIVGAAQSSDFPLQNPLANQNAMTGSQCGFVTNLTNNGTTLFFSTYLCGGTDDAATAVALDVNKDIYVTGFTESANFPTVNPVQASLAGGQNAFVMELAPAANTPPNGSSIFFSTFFGGGGDFANGIALDANANIYIAGFTPSSVFPTKNPVQANLNGSTNAFIAEIKLSPAAGNSTVYSTYLGGSTNDSANGIAVDAAGNAYVTGTAGSPDFPLVNSLQAPDAGGDPFVTKIAAGGGTLDFSTLFGGGGDSARAIALDSSNNIYIAGSTPAADFPTRLPLQADLPGFSSVGFVAELKTDGSDFIFSSYFGGSFTLSGGADTANGIAVDSNGNIYLAGAAGTVDFPTVNPFQATLQSQSQTNAFVAKIAPATPAGPQIFPAALNFTSTFQTQIVTLANGTNALTITSITLGGANPGDFTEFSTCAPPNAPNTIPPNVVCTFTIGFSPTAGGVRTATVSINDSSGTQSFSLTGNSTVTPPPPNGTITFNPSSLTFGSQEVGVFNSNTQNITITVTGTNPVTLTSTGSGGADPSDFFISGGTCNFGTPLAVGTICTVAVEFEPQAVGARSGTVELFGTFTGSPATVSATGTGVAPIASINPTSLQFGNQVITTTSAAQTVTLTATGGQLTNITPSIAAPFSISANTCISGTLPSGQSCTFSIVFSPTQTGFAFGQLVVTDSDSVSQTVSLQGFGLNAAATLSPIFPTSISFGRQTAGTTSNAQFVFPQNVGNTNLVFTTPLSGANANAFAASNFCSGTIAPGQSCAVSVTFTPPTGPGPFFATLTIQSGAAGAPQTVALTGTGVAPTTANLSPNPLVFPVTAVETASATEFAFMSNTGATFDNIVSATFGGADPGDFQLDFSTAPSNSSCPLFGGLLNAQASCVVGVKFVPTQAGLRTATLVVTDTATGTPQTINLQGGQATGGGLPISPASLPNGNIGGAYGQTLTVTGGVQPFTFSVSTGTLPAGLNLGTTSGSIGGVPTGPIGASTFMVTVTDSSSPTPQTGNATYTVTINAADASNNAELNGQYAALSSGFEDQTGTMRVSAASFTADGNGNITNGINDTNDVSGAQASVAFTGTYTLGADNRGTITISQVGGGGGAPLTITFAVGEIQGGIATKARFTRFDDVSGTNGKRESGVFLKQDPTAFNLAGVKGNYAFGDSGSNTSSGAPQSEVGFVTADGNGNFTTGLEDANNGGTIHANVAISGTYTAPTASNGRFTDTLTIAGVNGAITNVLYVVSASQVIYIGINSAGNTIFSGTAQLQAPPAGGFGLGSLSGNSVFSVQGLQAGASSNVHIGALSADGDGNFTAAFDGNESGTSSSGTASGTYTVAANGRSVLTFTTVTGGGGGGIQPAIVYLDGVNQGFVGFTDGSVSEGIIEPGGSGFTNATLSGNYFLGTLGPTENQVHVFSGVGSFNGVSAFQATTDESDPGGVLSADNILSTSYAVAANGRFTFTNESGNTIVGYIASGCKAEVISSTGSNPGIIPFECQVTPVSGPVAQLSTAALTFGAQVTGTTSAEQQVTVTNGGASPLNFTGFTATGDFACFAQGQSCALPNQQTANPPCSTATALAPSTSCDISVAFTPSATGTRNGTLSIADNATGSPQTVALTGTGLSGQFTVAPSSLNFGTVVINTTSPAQIVTVTNGTVQNQFILSIVPPASFAETDNCVNGGAPLAPGASCTINVTFTPTSATAFSGNLVITAGPQNSPPPTQFNVALTGNGTISTFTLTLAPGSSSTVTVVPGGTAAYGILVTGTPGINQTINFTASTTSNTITVTVSPKSVTITGNGNTQFALVLETFCRAAGIGPHPQVPTPGGGLKLLLLAMALAAMAWVYRRRPRWALSFALLMLVAIGGAACGGDPGANGPTPPGTYPVTLTATSGQQVQTLNLTLIVQ
jgi:beta-propeller repeat-containing protein/centrosomal CEP192-like protein/HYDIN/CFA65/VesB family protein